MIRDMTGEYDTGILLSGIKVKVQLQKLRAACSILTNVDCFSNDISEGTMNWWPSYYIFIEL
jgi:hypothetical protein